MKNRIYYCLFISLLFFFGFSNNIYSQSLLQEKDPYSINAEDKLEIIVHIMGEVNNPGKYKVRDDTNILELISTAGGPTEYSNLKNIKLTRGSLITKSIKLSSNNNPNASDIPGNQQDFNVAYEKRVIKINLKKYLESKKPEDLPVLGPGDVVMVTKNRWYTFQTVIRIISQIAIIAQAWYYYSQIEK